MGVGNFRHENRLAFIRSFIGILYLDTLDGERNFMLQRLYTTGINYQWTQDRMCNCNTVTRDAITIAIWSGVHPDTPLA